MPMPRPSRGGGAPDPSTTPASAVIWRVAWSLPVAGYLIAVLSTIPGLVLLLSTGVLLLLLGWWLGRLVSERRRILPAAAATTAATTTARPVHAQARTWAKCEGR